MMRDVPPVGTSGVGNCLVGLFLIPFVTVKICALRLCRADKRRR